VNLLAADGLITLNENPDHRRAKALIRLTDVGRVRLARMSEIQAVWASRIGNGLSAERLGDATSLLQACGTGSSGIRTTEESREPVTGLPLICPPSSYIGSGWRFVDGYRGSEGADFRFQM
jgi:hypothetical protein